MNNMLGITDERILLDEEERISKLAARELYDSGRLAKMPVGTFEGLREIHIALFGRLYDFAGKIRTVNTGKGNMRFTPCEGIDSALKFIDIMPNSDFNEIVDKLVQMNIVHPFLKGNARTMRIWLDVMLAEKYGVIVDWRKVDPRTYRRAMEISPSNSSEIGTLIERSVTSNVNRTMFLECIDANFAIEGLYKYSLNLL